MRSKIAFVLLLVTLQFSSYENIKIHLGGLDSEYSDETSSDNMCEQLRCAFNDFVEAAEKQQTCSDEEKQHLQNQLTKASQGYKLALENKITSLKKGIKEELSKTQKKIILDNNANVKAHIDQLKNELGDQMLKFATKDTLESINNKLDQIRLYLVGELKDAFMQEMESLLEKKLQQNHLSDTCEEGKQALEDQFHRQQEEINNQLLETQKTIILDTNQYIRTYLDQLKNEFAEKMSELATKDMLKNINSQIDSVRCAETTGDTNLPQDCKAVQENGETESKVYTIRPRNAETEFRVWCDLTTQGGGWAYLMHRFNGNQDFNLGWTKYKEGFGSISGEHWLGLQHLYELTSNKPTELLFELVDWDSKKVYARYDAFVIGSEAEDYEIKSLGGYSGDAGDAFKNHLGRKFNTPDHNKTDHCVRNFPGGWWYHNCFAAYLTGKYYAENHSANKRGIHWCKFHGYDYSLKEVKMMIKPLDV